MLPDRWHEWKDSLLRVVRDIDRHNIVIFAAGLAFFALLSATPLLVAVVSVYGLVSDPVDVERQVNALGELLPEAVRPLIAEQLREIVSTSSSGLSLGAAVSIAAAMWAGSKGVFYLFRGLNIAYGVSETRGYVRLKVVAFLFTVGGVLLAVTAIGLVAVLPALLDLLGLGAVEERLFELGRWPVLGAALLSGLALLYRFGPDRQRAPFRWMSPGAVVVTAASLGLALAFSQYIATFGEFNETYGSLGAAIALIVWLFVTAFLVLFGAELNAKREALSAGRTDVHNGRSSGPLGHLSAAGGARGQSP